MLVVPQRGDNPPGVFCGDMVAKGNLWSLENIRQLLQNRLREHKLKASVEPESQQVCGEALREACSTHEDIGVQHCPDHAAAP